MGGNGSLNLLYCLHPYHELKVVSSQKRKSKSLLSPWKFLSSQVQLAQPPSSGQLILAMPGYRPIIPFENLHLVDLKPQVMGLRIGYQKFYGLSMFTLCVPLKIAI